jgi:hypothetical protein
VAKGESHVMRIGKFGLGLDCDAPPAGSDVDFTDPDPRPLEILLGLISESMLQVISWDKKGNFILHQAGSLRLFNAGSLRISTISIKKIWREQKQLSQGFI